MRACFLGFVFGCGLIINFSDTTWTHFGWYMTSQVFASLYFLLSCMVSHVTVPKPCLNCSVAFLQVHVFTGILPLL